jgi:hypothetical protein
MKITTRKIVGLLAVTICLCCVCVLLVFAIFSGGSIIPTPVPAQVINTSLPIEIIIARTSSAAQTQTMQAMPPTPLPTATLAPLIEIPPTATIFIFQLQTNVAQPTEYIYSTNTPFILPTQDYPPIQSTQPSGGYCCKVCGANSQPCGDSCISLSYTCHQPPGCACK